MVLPVLAILACTAGERRPVGPQPSPGVDPVGPGQDSGSTGQDTGGGSDTSGSDTGGSDTGGSDTGGSDSGEVRIEIPTEPADWPGFRAVELDAETWRDVDYTLVRWEIGEDAPEPYATLDDGPPVFYTLQPDTTTPHETLPVLLWLHGGTIGSDAGADGLPENCSAGHELARDVVSRDAFIGAFAAHRRFVVVLPVNEWCDGWFGAGPADPVDPERHFGAYHVDRVLEFVRSGGAGFQPGEDLWAWGTSAGGGAAMVAAREHPEITGVIVDSSPCDTVTYWAEDDRVAMEHIFGGPALRPEGTPTEWYDRYRASSCSGMIEDLGVQTPVFAASNRQDQLVKPDHMEGLVTALQRRQEISGARFGTHDWDHASPGRSYHTQTRQTQQPYPYVTEAMLQFLSGREVSFVEAETACLDEDGPCTAGEPVTDEDASPWRNMSQAAGVQATGAGTMARVALPPGLPAGAQVRATAAVVADGTDDLGDDEVVLTLVYKEGEERRASADVLATTFVPDDLDVHRHGSRMVSQVRGTRLVFEVEDPSQGAVEVESAGTAGLALDGIWFSWVVEEETGSEETGSEETGSR